VGERNNEKVTILLSRAAVVIPWKRREQLVGRIREVSGTDSLIDSFEAVGTSRPVELNQDDKDLLLLIVRRWLEDVSAEGLPEGIFDLRNALIDDAHDRGAGP
jgi:hypothetical protein